MKKAQQNKVFGNALRSALSSKSTAEREEAIANPASTTKEATPQKVNASKAGKTSNKERSTPSAKRSQFGPRNRTANKRSPAKGRNENPEASHHGLEMEVEKFCSALGGVQDSFELSFFFANLLLEEYSQKRLHLIAVPSEARESYVVARKDIVFVLNAKAYALTVPREMGFGEHRIRHALRTVLQKCCNTKK